MDILKEVESYTTKHWADYSVSDAVEMAQLKIRLWKETVRKQRDYLVAREEYRHAKLALTAELRKSDHVKTEKKAEELAVLRLKDQKISMIKKKLTYDLFYGYRNDLNQLISSVKHTIDNTNLEMKVTSD